MIQKRFGQNANMKRWFWMITIAVVLLFSFGMSRVLQFQEATAESQEDDLSELAAELDALKAEHKRIQAKWQSELLAQVVPTLGDESNAVKRQFVDFLEELGSPGTPALVAMLQDPSKQVRKKAVDKLGKIGEDERKAGKNYDAAAIGLAMALKDTSDDVFREAIAELGDVRPTSAESIAVVIPALIAVQTKGSSSARDDVLEVLGQIGENLAKSGQSTDTIRDALILGLNDNSTKVRTNAIEELSDIRAASTETFTALIGVLSDKSKSVRARAEDVLIKLGKGAAATVAPMLADALTSSESAVTRGHIVDVLGAIGEELIENGDSGEMVLKPLLVALEDSVDDVRRNAADELGEMRATSPDVRAALTHALNDSSKAVRNAAKKAIRRIEAVE
ncbi:MAG: HEAT repeat domain-containing protein [Candidatus Poribacteria bacterium]|nr:HEAT repeat domain-containing protein [Candidatus Poribacteria bacterium]